MAGVGGTFGFIRLVPKNFFFDRARVLAATDRATNIYLASAGGFVMRAARNSMRKARRMKLSELPPAKQAIYRRKLSQLRDDKGRFKTREQLAAEGLAKAAGSMKLPFAPSKPGEPPRYREGSLKRLLFFAFEQDSRSVVIGPVGFSKSTAPRVLEYGGANQHGKHVAARPYMAPALEKVQPRLSRFWADAYARANRRAG